MQNEEKLKEYLYKLSLTLRERVDELISLPWEQWSNIDFMGTGVIGELTESTRISIDKADIAIKGIKDAAIQSKEQETRDEAKASSEELGDNQG